MKFSRKFATKEVKLDEVQRNFKKGSRVKIIQSFFSNERNFNKI